MTVEIGDEFRFTRNPGITYRITAMDDTVALLKLIKHPHGVDAEDYSHELLRVLESAAYTKVVPFFEVGKKYRSTAYSCTPWEILMISERDGERAAWATRKLGARIEWMTLIEFEYFEEVAD